MKNNGLKIPEKDQTYVKVGFSDYLKSKIICKSLRTGTSLFSM